MLQHVVEAEVLDLVVRAVDLLIGVLELRLDDKGRWVAEAAGGGVVGAGVATLCFDVGDIAVLMMVSNVGGRGLVKRTYCGDNLLDERGKTLIDIVDDHTHRLLQARIQSPLDIARHILLKHSLDITVVLLVARVDRLRTEQTTLFSRIPMELDSVLRRTRRNRLRPQQGPKRLEDRNSPTAIVVRARRSQNRRQKEVDTILVRAEHNRVVRLSRDARDDAELAPGVVEALGCRAVRGGAGLVQDVAHLAEEPFGGLDACLRLVVAGVVGGEVLEVLPHVIGGEGV